MKWFEKCYSRLLIDNHITDQRPEYMSRFSPEEYVRMVKLSGVESSMVYACDHNGNCYYPTQCGHQHANLHGRDIFGETTRLLRQAGVAPIAYYTVTFNNDCARRFPQAAARSCSGKTHEGRYHFTCPNQPEAVAFYERQIAEVLKYDVDGIFIDMTFWPLVCCCDACRRKFGRAIPTTIDWRNPKWVAFQRFREESMAEFAEKLTAFARATKSGVTVTHQFSPVLHGWYLGQSTGIAEASDYASGDFYGEKLQQRFGAKVFEAFSSRQPFEFMTSRCVNLRDHTSSKSDEELLLSALTTLANGGAYFFIDAINPDGTLLESFYQRLGKLNQRLEPFRKIVASLQARLQAEVGLYFSLNCCVNQDLDGMPLAELDAESSSNMSVRRNAVCEELMGTAELLTQLHIPYRVITERQEEYSGLKVLFLNQALYLNENECARIRQFVQEGGTLIATGASSFYDVQGITTGDFALAEVLGVHYSGEDSPGITYTGDELVSADGMVPLVTADADTQVKAILTFPDFPVNDSEHYASIHSNPPGLKHSSSPAFTVHPYGRGKCVWLAAPLLRIRQYSQQAYLRRILGEFLPAFVETENLPGSAELTLLKAKGEAKYLLCLVNAQNELPVIPLHQVKLKLHWDVMPRAIHCVSSGKAVPFTQQDGMTEITLEQIDETEFLCIEEAAN
ncbi:MAG: beta-galactosidase trimerization domain-containing protein [Victivallales bacterium]|nr:beta-galactosidase trimerization domain-containing protein [Victivallales bacterium]